MQIYVHLWQYLGQLYLERDMFQTNILDKIKIRFMINDFFRKFCHLWDNVKTYTYSTAREGTDNSTVHALCVLGIIIFNLRTAVLGLLCDLG